MNNPAEISSIIKNQIEKVTTDALKAVNPDVTTEIEIEIPKEKAHGDFSINTAMKLTKILRKSPQIIAKELTEAMNFEGTYIDKCEIAGPGFINFYLKSDWLHSYARTGKAEIADP